MFNVINPSIGFTFCHSFFLAGEMNDDHLKQQATTRLEELIELSFFRAHAELTS